MIERGVAAFHDDVGGSFAVLVGQGKAVAGGRHAGAEGAGAGVSDLGGRAAIDQREAAAGDALAVEGGAGLERMAGVIMNRDVFAEERSADAAGEKAALVAHGGGAEVGEDLAHQVEDGRGFEDDRIAAGGKLARLSGKRRLARGAASHSDGVEGVAIGRGGLGPAGAVGGHGGDGELRRGVAVVGIDTGGVQDGLDKLACRADADGVGDGLGALGGGGSSGGRGKVVGRGNRFGTGERGQIGIGCLGACNGNGLLDGGADGVVVETIGGGARGALSDDRPDGEVVPLFGDVLVDGAIGEAREGRRCGADHDLDIRRAEGPGGALDGGEDLAAAGSSQQVGFVHGWVTHCSHHRS